MARTAINSAQIFDGGVKRPDINTSDAGSALITKVVAGPGVGISSTGADSGTGDVTIITYGTTTSLGNGEESTLVKCTPVYISATSTVKKGLANLTDNDIVGFVYDASIAPAAFGKIQTSGILTATLEEWDAVTGSVGGLTPGVYYYLSTSVAGRITTVAPTSAGGYVVKVGFAIGPTDMAISIGRPIYLATLTMSSLIWS